jgi:rubrerythrin
MVTTVGTGNDIHSILEDFIYLERDAIEAYDSTISRLGDPQWASKIEAFKEDHLRHLRELSDYAQSIGAPVPREADSKSMLTTGKIALADLAGDSAILKAMSSNETDTITAYENGTRNDSIPADLRPMMERALEDERRHKAWMDDTSRAS